LKTKVNDKINYQVWDFTVFRLKKGDFMKLKILLMAVAIVAGVVTLSSNAFSQSKKKESEETRRATSSANVFMAIMKAEDNAIPNKVIDKVDCIAVFPNVINAALVVGGQYGKGMISCREGTAWSAPAFLRMTGGSFGFQIGGQSTDFVLLFMTESGVKNLLSNKFTIGTEISVAAGPVGRTAGASTDISLEAQILSYSRTKGLFAGISLKGVSIAPDKTAIENVYGKDKTAKMLIKEASNTAPKTVEIYPNTLKEYAK
jgi:lipid-binding SYLF domain-containing protein